MSLLVEEARKRLAVSECRTNVVFPCPQCEKRAFAYKTDTGIVVRCPHCGLEEEKYV